MTESEPGKRAPDLANAFEEKPRVPKSNSTPKDTIPLTYEQTLRRVKIAQGVLESVYSTSSLDETLLGGEEEGFSLNSVVEDPTANVENQVEREMQMQGLRKAMSLLPTKPNRVVTLKFLEGKTDKEIGEELGISAIRVRLITRQGLSLLRMYMDKENSEGEMQRSAPRFLGDIRKATGGEYKDDPDIQPGSNGELSPLLQRLADDMSNTLMKGRTEFKERFPNAFFPDETMTDMERQIFIGVKLLVDINDFPRLCKMWGVTAEEGLAIFNKAERKYYQFVLD